MIEPHVTLWYTISAKEVGKMSKARKAAAATAFEALGDFVKTNFGYAAEDWSMFGDTQVCVDIALNEQTLEKLKNLTTAPGLPTLQNATFMREPNNAQATPAVIDGVTGELTRLKIPYELY
jgi:hypothetical protein